MLFLGAASAIGQRWWPASLLVHFWPHLVVILIITGAASLLTGSRVSAAAHAVGGVTLMAAIASNLGGAPSGLAGDAGVGGEPEVRALFANVGRWNVDHDRLVALIRWIQPDIIALAEVDDPWIESLATISDDYPHRVLATREDNFGTALLSRFPLASGSIESIGRLRLPSIVATVETSGGSWRILVTHPVPPFHASAYGSRNSQIAGLAAYVGDDTIPTLVLGDLNASPWSPYVRDLRARAGLTSAATGLRALYTWPVGIPLFALALDHCLYSTAAVAVGYRVLENIGSDHYPILCELSRRE